MQKRAGEHGFSILQLAIALVIIGLIVGGILVGADIIQSAAARAQIAQIDKYQSAASAFEAKYGYLPGDIPNPVAGNFGFATRGLYAGEGDGNGVMQGVFCDAATCQGGYYQSVGETVMFWSDLTYANGMNLNMIDGSFTTAKPNGSLPSSISGSGVANYFPAAKIGQNNFIYIWSFPYTAYGSGVSDSPTPNYFGLTAIKSVNSLGYISGSNGLTVFQAYSIDKKIDDGLPQTGTVQAFGLNYVASVSISPWANGLDNGLQAYTTSTAGSASTCFDNGSTTGAKQQYSTKQKNGPLNCVLSFQLQN